ncbi:MAG: hypothetical protein FWG83_06705 [Oscillospiraceae bacterium]|nr:hypothetical protein [Oscillospiraceae bacterium]
MEIVKYDGNSPVDEAVSCDEPLIAAISTNGKKAFVSQIDESVEHYILLQKSGVPGSEIDKYFRITFGKSGADWTFVCPNDYKNITDKTRRISAYYKDGFTVISSFLAEFGYFCDISIPKRYAKQGLASGGSAGGKRA